MKSKQLPLRGNERDKIEHREKVLKWKVFVIVKEKHGQFWIFQLSLAEFSKDNNARRKYFTCFLNELGSITSLKWLCDIHVNFSSLS